MRLMVVTLTLGPGAILLHAVGVFAAAELGLVLRQRFGHEYEVWAFWAIMLLLASVVVALYRWQEHMLGWLAPLIAGTAPEVMYCQMCGTVGRHDISFCPQCSGARFGIAKPGEKA